MNCVDVTANGASSKVVSPESMFLPTLNLWLSQSQWVSNNYSPGSATGPLTGLHYRCVYIVSLIWEELEHYIK